MQPPVSDTSPVDYRLSSEILLEHWPVKRFLSLSLSLQVLGNIAIGLGGLSLYHFIR